MVIRHKAAGSAHLLARTVKCSVVNAGDGVIRSGSKTCRTAANVLRIRSLIVDLEGAPIAPVLSSALPPDWIVQSSHDRWHAYWLVDDCPLHAFEPAQAALAARFVVDGKAPRTVIVVTIERIYFQCAKAVVRSRLIRHRIAARTSERFSSEGMSDAFAHSLLLPAAGRLADTRLRERWRAALRCTAPVWG